MTDERRPRGHGTTCHLLLWAGAMAAVMLIATGCLGQDSELSLEEQAQQIDRSLMCPVCPGETVDQSQALLAKQMRAIIREKLAAGESRQAILDFFVERYGEDVLAEPTKSGFNLLVWTLPVVGLLAAGVALVLALRAMQRGRGLEEVSPVGTSSTSEEMEPYLSRVGEEMRQVLEDTLPPPAGQSRG